MWFACCSECNEPATGPDGLCTLCRVTPKPKRSASAARRDQLQVRSARRR